MLADLCEDWVIRVGSTEDQVGSPSDESELDLLIDCERIDMLISDRQGRID